MARSLFTILFLALSVVPAFSQITCIPMGALSTCSGPGFDQTQVPLGSNQGVIITDHDTMTYTIITPAPRTRFDPTPLPTMPRPSTQHSPALPYGYGMDTLILPNDPGLGNGLGAFGGGLLGE